jgi:probable F420-dependent oxidoreductase
MGEAARRRAESARYTRVMRLGLTFPFLHHMPLADYLALAREVEGRGYDMAWMGEAGGADAVTAMTLLASATGRLRIASGVLPFQTRTPVLLAQTAATLAHLAPGRIALGLGVSSETIVAQWHGLPFRRPLAQLREAVQVVRAALTGERVSFEGEFYRVRNFRLLAPIPREPVRIYLAALGPRALELAGEIADGVLLNWLAPASVPDALAHLRVGAARAGRTLEGFEVAGYIRTCVTDAPAPARAHLARDITGYAVVDAYATFFRQCGFESEVAALRAAWGAGDRAGAVKQLSDRLLDGLGVVGDEAFCRDRIEEFARAGLTQPVVVPFSPDPAPLPSLLRTVRAF